MRLAALAVCLTACIAFAQPPTTTVTGPVYDQFGQLYTGQLTISISARTATAGGVAVLQNPLTLYIAAGVLNVALVPNASITPSGTTYLFNFGSSRQATCTVPASGPVTVASACVFGTTAETTVSWGQINGLLQNQTDLWTYLQGTQPLITLGATTQYFRGDLSLATLNTTAVPEGSNLYFTSTRASLAAPVQMSAGSGAPLSACTAPTATFLQLYFDQTAQHLYLCAATNSWALVGSGGGGGGVSSVALSLPSAVFLVTGSPITGSGTLTGAFQNQNANLVFAGPTSGTPGTPGFRALVSADVPPIALNLSGNGGVTGNLLPGNLNGGTNAGSCTYWRGDGTWTQVPGTCTNTVPCTATPIFDFSLGAIQKITLSCNVTSSSVANLVTDKRVEFVICQPSSGALGTWAYPGAITAGVSPPTILGKCSSQWFSSPDGIRLIPENIGVINQ